MAMARKYKSLPPLYNFGIPQQQMSRDNYQTSQTYTQQ